LPPAPDESEDPLLVADWSAAVAGSGTAALRAAPAFAVPFLVNPIDDEELDDPACLLATTPTSANSPSSPTAATEIRMASLDLRLMVFLPFGPRPPRPVYWG
jgi:hypothetical protein